MKFHPLADVFPLIEGAEFDDLVADIKAYGLIEPIIVFEDMILDGRNRYRACEAAGVEPRFIPGDGRLNGNRIEDPTAFVISTNIHRRHLTGAQKRDLIAALLKMRPETSNNAVAKQIKADDKTVAKVRRELEATSEIPKLEKTVGTDGRGRKQPHGMIGNWEIAAMADALADRCEHATIALLGWPSSASGRIRQLMAIAAPDWLHDNIQTGLSSGEHVTFQVRDPSTATSFRKPRAARPDDLRQTRSISFATIQPLGSLIGGGPK